MSVKRNYLFLIIPLAVILGFAALNMSLAAKEKVETAATEEYTMQIRDFMERRSVGEIPMWDIELKDGGYVTGAVTLYNGQGYGLTEQEYRLLERFVDKQLVLGYGA